MIEVGFCRERNLAEPLAGTATESIVRWILLEDTSPWGAKPPRDSGLPASVITWLQARDREPGVRVQLIRRPGASVDSRRRLILAEAPANPAQRRLLELDVVLEQIPQLDVDTLLASTPPSPALAQLWLVCTHGTRDRCCAKWGMPLFETLRQRDPTRVWQCSHLGGHRFAPTFLTLPDGLMWGRFNIAKIPALADALGQSRLAELASLRGRCCHPRPVQAAECLLRMRDGIVDDAALELIAASPTTGSTGPGATRVEFRVGEDRASVEIESVALDFDAPPSCGDEAEPRTTLRLRSAQAATT